MLVRVAGSGGCGDEEEEEEEAGSGWTEAGDSSWVLCCG
jgi:hypothetical protein